VLFREWTTNCAHVKTSYVGFLKVTEGNTLRGILEIQYFEVVHIDLTFCFWPMREQNKGQNLSRIFNKDLF
jgi:hypothetical protein